MTSLILNKFDDKGWAFSKIFGLVIPALILWSLSYLKILKFTQLNCYILIAIIAVINLIIFIKNKEKFKDIKQKWSNIVVIELMFLLLFTIWVYIRSFIPFLNEGTEHFMNYGFINKIMNAEYLPIEDIWLSGNTINYYYFGQYISAFLSKISFTEVKETYNLMLALIAAFLFVFPYSIGKNLGNSLIKDNTKKSAKIISVAIGLVTALAVTLGGTLYYTIHRLILDEPDYTYVDIYNYIGSNPETNDIGITAFPSYMNIEGDLHAHHIDTMFTLTTLALLLQYMLSDKEEGKVKKFLNPNILLLGVMLGIHTMTNFWDLPIYLVIMTVVITVKNFIKYKESKQKVFITLLHLLEIFLMQTIITFLFMRHLYISASQVHFTNIMSPFYKLLVLWGLPTACILMDIFAHIYTLIKEKKGSLFKYINEMNLADIYVIILGVCAIGLVIIPEIVYVKDIYSSEYKRANTMFKLTFNAITLFNISTSYILIKYLYKKTNIVAKIATYTVLLIFITTFGYGINAITWATGNFKSQSYDLRSNAEEYIHEQLPEDYNAIQWIKQNVDRNAVILESVGGSYTLNSRISVFTANPTVLGWHGHEWVWRAKADYSVPDAEAERWAAIFKIYQTEDKQYIEDAIKKYNISYIYIGNMEYETFKDMKIDTLLSLGEVVYKQTENYTKSPVYIVKVQ